IRPSGGPSTTLVKSELRSRHVYMARPFGPVLSSPSPTKASPSKEHAMPNQESHTWLVRGRGPGFVIWLSAPNSRVSGFITWAETGVAELSPAIRDAWHFPTLRAANDAARRALGPAIETYATAVFPAHP